jgi:hypothetical protein
LGHYDVNSHGLAPVPGHKHLSIAHRFCSPLAPAANGVNQ